MPEIGEIQRGREVGYKSSGGNRYIWHACKGCGKERWVGLRNNEAKHKRCHSCAGKLRASGPHHQSWKGGRAIQKYGYITVWLAPDDFFRPMASKKGYVLEHRLVVAKALGRCLHSWEIVHHKKGFAKGDNRYPQTLELVSDLGHKQITLFESRISKLEARVEEQTKLIKLLQWRNRMNLDDKRLLEKELKNEDSNQR